MRLTNTGFGTAKQGWVLAGAALLASALVVAPKARGQVVEEGGEFVERSGNKLTLAGQSYRFSGPNIEWLGLEGYGPHDPMGPRYADRFEVDDAFATASEMGARVVRSQTMGDTVGCPLCIEPEEGRFNEAGFQSTDYALATARKEGMKVIITLIGDCATCPFGGISQYLAWEKKSNPLDFFTDPKLIAAFERHIDAVLNHKNALTGVRYKDDPTILAWENCNMCGLVATFLGAVKAYPSISAWVETIGAHVKAADPHHLYLDTSGIFRGFPGVLDNPSTDAVALEYYPHWDMLFGSTFHTTAADFNRDAAKVTAHGKVYIVNEFGWDRTDWKTPEDLQAVLDTLAGDANISGDGFWALQAHLANFGFQSIPAETRDLSYAEHAESGEWWALYYPGVTTLVNSAGDMADRAQRLRAHAYAMKGQPVPKHKTPPAPAISLVGFAGLVAWRGSAGAVRYSVERLDPGAREWKTVCDRCATDSDDPWIDPHPLPFGARYRVTAWNADGVPSLPSAAR